MSQGDLEEKLQRGERLNVLFLNDIGFQHGAGMAHRRQVQSFLLLGHRVMGLCWSQGPVEGSIPIVPPGATGVWLGMRELPHLHSNGYYDEEAVIEVILEEARPLEPDVIIVGNLHGARWPLRILPALQSAGYLVIAYMHDCYLVAGRCAYPGHCLLYETGCDETCPTADEYPVLAPAKIPGAWKLRREIFCGANGIPLATNSCWTLSMAQKALKGLRYADVVYYGLNERLFKQIDRALARRLLGIPQDRLVILSGAVHVNEHRKGGHLFQKVVSALAKKALLLVFGAQFSYLKGVKATGLLRDYRKMPLLYSAADLFLGTSLEEAFGQTFCEAAACSLPIVAFKVGGIPEVARHGVNARLVEGISVEGMLAEIDFFMKNPQEREAYGAAGRAMVEEEFTLRRQGERWLEYLRTATSL